MKTKSPVTPLARRICEPTLQGVFNYVTAHLFKQGRLALSMGKCRYRGSEGTSCAVGCLIRDEHYSPYLEGVGIASAGATRAEQLQEAVARSLGVEALSPDMIKLLDWLQGDHDEAGGYIADDAAPARLRQFWTERFERTARKFNLTFNPSTTAPCSPQPTSSTP